ncbi:conserved hypothetical protein [Culex quinquefasciatus]|uniref:Ig-like domain-containing protein n=1 Tax=Culex quinquefasciatus TaxID=7176 RepID=B0WBS0_CULQU|nr:conserved hypothetical protein [Culex quinquefasciatus]|eukprot:XP_001846154.1 conserved hypothetical protein [Culex quinquefasciatus]
MCMCAQKSINDIGLRQAIRTDDGVHVPQGSVDTGCQIKRSETSLGVCFEVRRGRCRPQPSVKWLINGILVDEQNEHNSGDVIENRLLWPAIQRSDLNSIFTCQATNTQLAEPKESSYVLDLHRPAIQQSDVADVAYRSWSFFVEFEVGSSAAQLPSRKLSPP